MKSLLIIILITLVSCGDKKDPRKFRTTDNRLYNYKVLFTDEALRFGVHINLDNLPINFGDDIGVGNDAACFNYGYNSYREILVRKSKWDRLSTSSKIGLLFHEIGHCSLGLPHNDVKDNQTGYPISLMSHYIPSPTIFFLLYDSYLAGMFLGNTDLVKDELRHGDVTFTRDVYINKGLWEEDMENVYGLE